MSIDEVMAVAFRLATTSVQFTTPSGELDSDGESAVQERAMQLRAAIEQHVAEAVAREREGCAKVCEAESARILSKQSDRDDDPVNVNLRMIACVLPDVAAAIRAREDHETQGVRQPCGECHLTPGERCDICGARADHDEVPR